MKKLNYLLAIVILFCCTLTVHAAEEKKGPFYFDWENEKIEDALEYNALFNDNIAFKKGSVVVRTIEEEKIKTIVTRHDAKGKELAKITLEDIAFYSIIADDNNIYLVVRTIEENEVQKVIKLDENLKLVKELVFEEDFTPGVDGMINARVFGHDILAVKDDYLYVFCGEEYMLKTKLDLSKWENMEYSKTSFAKYFPDLSAEYDLLAIWMDKLMSNNVNGTYLDMEVTTHVYENKIISSGMRFYTSTNNDEMPFAGFIRIKDNTGKVIFEEINNNYAKIIEARVIGDYVVAIALTEGSIGMTFMDSPDQLGNDIIVYDMDGNLVQTIETEGSYIFLNEIDSGFIATHVESCKDVGITDQGMGGLMKASGSGAVTADDTERVCTFNNEAYYLPLEVETKVIGKGNIEAIKDSRRGEVITFKVTPEKGYVLSEVKVTDKNGNVVIFTDYTFTMPNADVIIEATFNPENSETSDIAIIAFITIAAFGLLAMSLNKKKMNWFK